ncbi:DeoR/GlpR family DNA-binding transcription regulator [Paenibacillus sp. MBLB4367]|uniref:DeoR/GlpR family DNA-binding transcription regulator n=1 Tax=Paenibacillus sp. MBLB4367 TaxID=3384767 RepID=UPI0039081302
MSLFNDRQQQIIDLITADGEIKISDLKDHFAVTEMTIRRDLEKLEQHGIVRRTFGGAILIGKDVSLRERTGSHEDEKKRIGRLAAALIEPGESVFIDGGSTTLQVARHLRPGTQVTVITNALNVAAELIEKSIPTIVIGGMVRETTSSMSGPMAVEAMSKMAFDRAFLGASGLNVRDGFSNSNMYEAELKRVAITRSAEVNIVLDHTKFGASSLVSFADIGHAHRMIADRLPEGELLTACREAGMEITAAGD